MPRPESQVLPSGPLLSIVVASLSSRNDLDDWFNAIAAQTEGRNVEIIVAGSSVDGSFPLIIKEARVSLIPFPGRTPLPTLLGRGLACAEGEVIVITDSTSIPDPYWVDAILRAHRSPSPVIGGVVEMDDLVRAVDIAAYFCEYGQFMQPLREGVVNELPGNNLSFKRAALGDKEGLLRSGFWKTFWCKKLQGKGIRLVSSPSIVIQSRKTFGFLQFVVRRFHHGRCFAGMRVSGASPFARGYYVIGSPVLPILFLTRMIKSVMKKRRRLKEFLLTLPISSLAIIVWSVGELLGYLSGPGKSSSHIY